MTEQTQSSSFEVTELVFKSELTAQGLADLRAKYPSDLVVDMKDEEAFKAARKVRTERNKLTAAIDDRRKDVVKILKDHGDNLISQVNEIYSVIVDPFEAEDERRKKIAAEEKARHEKMLAEQRELISGFRSYITDANKSEATSEDVSGMVDALSNVDFECFHQEVVHEAMAAVKEVSEQLGAILVQKIEAERIKKQMEEAEKARAEEEAKRAEEKRLADEAMAAEKAKSLIAERINNLRMIPVNFMNESSLVIGKKIASLEKYVVPESEFGDRHVEACEAKSQVVEQLKKMFVSAQRLEALEQQDAERNAIAQQQNVVAEASQEVPYQEVDQGMQQSIYHEQQRETKTPEEVLSSMGRASDLIKQQEPATAPTLKTCIDAWYFEHNITSDAYSDLMGILADFGVNLN